VVQFVATQLGVRPEALEEYGRRRATVAEHFVEVQAHLGFRRASVEDKRELTSWLVDRALEHDRPTLLLELACDRLRRSKVTRPALNRLERIVARARVRARRETYRLVAPLLTPTCRAVLDALLVADEETGRTPLSWLRQDVTRSTPPLPFPSTAPGRGCAETNAPQWGQSLKRSGHRMRTSPSRHGQRRKT
jgi:hypothetical protein